MTRCKRSSAWRDWRCRRCLAFTSVRPDAAALGRVVVNYADLGPEQFTAALRAALPTLRDAKS